LQEPVVAPRQGSARTELYRIALLLLALQAARAAIAWLLWQVLGQGADGGAFQVANAAATVLVAAGAWLVLRPSLGDLGLDWGAMSARGKGLCGFGGLFVAGMLAAALALDLASAARSLHLALILPAFEEALFRGYAWRQLSGPGEGGEGRERYALVATTLLFALWHLGYADTLLHHPLAGDAGAFLLGQVAAGLALGLVTGAVRWRSGALFGPLLIHAFWNLMAP
jgi:membrane protease YdiL (CAAX protease family)